ncbi:hypothetical protein BDZ94DRAFT_1249512 [Collybia nuda]|uniref:Secreted protein n=1 Tax=Collybia nuda TaxID=64659 RepID=A0A9P5YDV1_9AGAR|nr:hypothetical protein BDZ94DRAFT_1249512 [Collybia nuda]
MRFGHVLVFYLIAAALTVEINAQPGLDTSVDSTVCDSILFTCFGGQTSYFQVVSSNESPLCTSQLLRGNRNKVNVTR